MSRYLVTGFNSETGAIFRAEERDQAGAEHCASSWVETQPIGSLVEVMEVIVKPPWDDQLYVRSSVKRVMGGVEWTSP